MCAVESEMISIFSCNDLLDFGVALARRLRLPFVLGLGGGDLAPRRCLVCSVAQVVEDVKDVELAHTRLCTGVQLRV